ncbi:DsbA family protein [Pantoea sp. OXWO6B1]|uniref:DsbA family protein n=1 Tax=Pantoea sp. OXWO6B1 TaxID=1835724 RepID=UPI0007C740C1|nr:DsbA family protein [Pantoea sp. OXWO6B1]OAD97993.1 disulfide bond formation protein DsbA [Pantoea sp. OXWO6B1]
MFKKKNTLAAILFSCLISGISFSAYSIPSKYSPELDAHIGEVAKAYLLSNPGVLVEVSKKLQQEQLQRQIKIISNAILQNRNFLLNDIDSPSYGPKRAKVALIEFFDYQCIVCARQSPILEKLMKNNPQVRYVFKEWPIFAQRWKISLTAAKAGLLAWQKKGGDAYLLYHNAIFASGHNEGNLTLMDIAAAGGSNEKNGKVIEELARTDELAQKLGLQGTPAIIVMPVSGATTENITIIPGGASQSLLQEAINKASAEVHSEMKTR